MVKHDLNINERGDESLLMRRTTGLAVGLIVLLYLCALLSFSESGYGTNDISSVNVSPSCGPESGFPLKLNATGFEPEGLVHWKLLRSDGTETLGPFGIFRTDENGSFSETTHTESQSPDVYTIYFFDDSDNDGKPDQGGSKFATRISIPC